MAAAAPLNANTLGQLSDREVKKIVTALDGLTAAVLTLAGELRFAALSGKVAGLTEDAARREVRLGWEDVLTHLPPHP